MSIVIQAVKDRIDLSQELWFFICYRKVIGEIKKNKRFKIIFKDVERYIEGTCLLLCEKLIGS